MNILIKRLRMNGLYTEGELLINDLRTTFTVECTNFMLPAGDYHLRIVKRSARKQSLNIFVNSKDTGWKVGIGHSYRSSKAHRIICIGEPLIPGAIYKGTKEYERLIDRLTKCKDRKEEITLTISETRCIENRPIKHWLD